MQSFKYDNKPETMQNDTELSVQDVIKKAGKRKKSTFHRIAILLIVVTIVCAAVFFIQKKGSSKAQVSFQTAPVQRGDLVVTVTATGNLAATNEVDVGSELSGRILKMTADYNDAVEKDQPLAYLDDSKYRATVAKSKSGVATAKANYQEALATQSACEKKLKRYQKTRELTQGKLPSLEDMEETEADCQRAAAALDAAQAAIDSAQASLDSDESDLKKTVIYSPINGVVLSKSVEVGQTVAASLEAPVLYTLAEDLRNMELLVDVDEADVGQVKEGQSATFTVDAYPERSFQAEITQVRYAADENDGVITYQTVLKVDNPDLTLRPGMTATADITVQKHTNTLLIPNAALRFSPPKPSQPSREKQGILNSIMPGPPRFKRSGKQVEIRPGNEQGEATLWILHQGQPQPVRVSKIATDGVMTAVQSDQLSADNQVITTAISQTR